MASMQSVAGGGVASMRSVATRSDRLYDHEAARGMLVCGRMLYCSQVVM